MKLGILTFQCTQNYGAVLQAYALKYYLEKLGYSVEIINYTPSYLTERYKVFDSKRIFKGAVLKILPSFFKELLLLRRRLIRTHNFNSFRIKHFNLSGIKFSEVQSVELRYDTIVVGSDQVWNKVITKGFDPYFWGELKNSSKVSIISFAASMEAKQLEENDKKTITNHLQNFRAISVRENVLQNILTPLTPKKIQRVIDPTLLLTNNDWNLIAKEPTFKSKYVLVYHVRWSPYSMRIAREIARTRNLEIVQLTVGLRAMYRKNLFQTESPEKFLGWFKNADFIVTASFHGTAFSLIYNKEFITLNLDDNRDTRNESILNELDLSDIFVNHKNKMPNLNKIDYSKINEKLDKLRNEAKIFLTNNLL
jgi:hypothetical protein